MDVYYSHSMRIYDTEREKKEIKFLNRKFGRVCNPNGDIEWRGDMQPYIEAVKKSDMVVLSEYEGHIGRGVFVEVKTALDEKKPVYVIKNDNDAFSLHKVDDVNVVDPFDWKVKYGEIKIENKE